MRFEKLATVVDPTHDRVEKGSVLDTKHPEKAAVGLGAACVSCFSTGSAAGMTQPAQHRERALPPAALGKAATGLV